MDLQNNTASEQAKHWFQDEGADFYAKFEDAFLNQPRKLFLEYGLHFTKQDNPVVLDLGCGTGTALHYLLDRLPHGTFYGCEPALSMLHKAKQVMGDKAQLYPYKAKEIPANDWKEKFDLVLSYSNLRFWENPVEGLNTLYQILKPGGVAYILDLRQDIDEELKEIFLSQARSPEETTFLTHQLNSALPLAALEEIVQSSVWTNFALRVGGLFGYDRNSLEAFELIQQNQAIAQMVFALNDGGFRDPKLAETVIHMIFRK